MNNQPNASVYTNVQSPLHWYGCSNDLIESFRMQSISLLLLLLWLLYWPAAHHRIAMNWNELICYRPQMIIGSLRSREMYIRFIYGNWTNQWDWDVMAQNNHLTITSQATIANQSANSAISIKKARSREIKNDWAMIKGPIKNIFPFNVIHVNWFLIIRER